MNSVIKFKTRFPIGVYIALSNCELVCFGIQIAGWLILLTLMLSSQFCFCFQLLWDTCKFSVVGFRRMKDSWLFCHDFVRCQFGFALWCQEQIELVEDAVAPVLYSALVVTQSTSDGSVMSSKGYNARQTSMISSLDFYFLYTLKVYDFCK